MKQLLVLSILIAGFVSCTPNTNSWVWAIKNETEQTLKFKFLSHDANQTGPDVPYKILIIPSDGKIFIRSITTGTNYKHNLHFDHYFDECANSYGTNVYWQILSDDDVVLKTWNYSNKDLPNQQFFNESGWDYGYGAGVDYIKTMFIWTYNILPEDIRQTD